MWRDLRNFTSCEDTEEFNLELAVEDYSGEASPFLDVIENSWPTWSLGPREQNICNLLVDEKIILGFFFY